MGIEIHRPNYRYHTAHLPALHRYGPTFTNITNTADRGAASCNRFLSIGVGLWVKRFVGPYIAYEAWTLVRKTSKS